MDLRTAHDIGRCIRASRKRQNLTQARLAERIGTSQKWVSAVENGSGTSELGAVMRCLRALGVDLVAHDIGVGSRVTHARPPAITDEIDLGSLLGELGGNRHGSAK